MKPKLVFVFAAGLGVRMRPLTEKVPKPLIPVAGKPLIDHCLDRFAEDGVETAIVNVHYLADPIEAHLKARTRPRDRSSPTSARGCSTRAGRSRRRGR